MAVAQDGRGMGLPFKLATMQLQDALGMDTVEAAESLAKDSTIDKRTYAGLVCVLIFFAISTSRPIAFATQNPWKESVLIENGYRIAARVSVRIPDAAATARHTMAKRQRLSVGDGGALPVVVVLLRIRRWQTLK
jgi:GTP cyclohydrolase II